MRMGGQQSPERRLGEGDDGSPVMYPGRGERLPCLPDSFFLALVGAGVSVSSFVYHPLLRYSVFVFIPKCRSFSR